MELIEQTECINCATKLADQSDLYLLAFHDTDSIEPKYLANCNYSFQIGDTRRKYINLYFTEYFDTTLKKNIKLENKTGIIAGYRINHEYYLTQGYKTKNGICYVNVMIPIKIKKQSKFLRKYF